MSNSRSLRRSSVHGCMHLSRGLPLLLLVGCGLGEGTPPGDPGSIPLFVPDLPASDGLLERADLQAVVDLQVARDGSALRDLLNSPDPAIRARAALALASVQDSGSEAALAARLSDPVAAVRRSAAFALGQLVLADGGAALGEAIRSEPDPGVRLALVEAIGKRGGREAVQAILATPPGDQEAEAWTLALSRSGLRDIRPPGLLGALFVALEGSDAEVRAAAAYYFGRSRSATAWQGDAARVRRALDGAPADDPAAMHLVLAIGRLRAFAEDAPRIIRWLHTGGDWRIRANAATAVLDPEWLVLPEVREALFLALDDPSEQVRLAAAGSLALAVWNVPQDRGRAAALLEGPPEDWRIQAALLPTLVYAGDDEDLAWRWLLRGFGSHPTPTAVGIDLIAGRPGSEVTELLFQFANDPEPLVRAAAVRALADRWPSEGGAEADARRYFVLFLQTLADTANLPAVRAAQALSHPAMLALGGDEALESAFEERRPTGDTNVLLPILASMGSASTPFLQSRLSDTDPRIRQEVATALERVAGIRVPERRPAGSNEDRIVDWPALAALGSSPRVELETEKGVIVLRLLPEWAPLTVQSFVEQVRRGAHDGVPFHRVMSNFMAQGGDVGLGNGDGGPGYEIPSEFTVLPFRRGVVGMASAGKDTEGSQFFLVHSDQPHLDGAYGAFGWMETGADVLDRILVGDRVIRAEVVEGTTP